MRYNSGQVIRSCQGDPMKKLLLSVAALTFAAGSSAFAADLRMPVKAPQAPPPPVVSWTGCYIDGGVGYGFWNQDNSLTGNLLGPGGVVVGTVSTATTTSGGRGWLGRVGGGCDYQFSQRFVIGGFADFDFSDMKGSNNPNELAIVGGFTSPVTANMKERDAVYAGARLGYLITPSVLGYVDGGWTEARFEQGGSFLTLNGAATGLNYPNYNTNGWFVGGGYEYNLSDIIPIPGLFWRTEYRFAQYDHRNLTEVVSATGVPTGNVEHSQAFVQTVTSSLVWRFNFWGR
jgi:outer membrane immunogenic protein